MEVKLVFSEEEVIIFLTDHDYILKEIDISYEASIYGNSTKTVSYKSIIAYLASDDICGKCDKDLLHDPTIGSYSINKVFERILTKKLLQL